MGNVSGTKGMIVLVLLILLLLASLLTVFKAPTYHLWLLAILVSEFPMILIGVTLALLLCLFWVETYRLTSAIIGISALLLFFSPIVRAYTVASKLKQELTAAFGLVSIGNTNLQPFSFFKLFKISGVKQTDYKTLSYGHDAEQTLDFYPGNGSGKKPCIIVVHGGSWSSGDSKQLPELNLYLSIRGYNVVSINYHLAPKCRSPVAVSDVDAAFKYLRKNADHLHIDTNNFVLLGRSAGAQIALLAAYTQQQPGLKGVIDFYGPADMVWGYSLPASKLVMDSRGVMERYLGGTYKAVPEQYFASSPIEFVNRQTVPTLIIHGDNDVLVSPLHSKKLDEKLQRNGIKRYYLELPWATHGFDYNINGPSGQLSTYAVVRFLDAVIK